MPTTFFASAQIHDDLGYFIVTFQRTAYTNERLVRGIANYVQFSFSAVPDKTIKVKIKK
jgi:hypothetical protein